MICISINQESRRLALVDMFNAAKQCDLLEIRLDRFGMSPELGSLVEAKPKPIIMSCRRPSEGGHWDGSEAERLALLRQAIVSKADYIELELDVADEVRRFPPSQRVISYVVKPDDTADDIQERYREAQSKHADIIKLTTAAKTPEEAWPLVQILAKPRIPTVVVGLGKPGVMLTVLGKKIGAPWAYAALERGMEAYPGQPTVEDLNAVYHYGAIDSSTRLLGVTGFGDREYAAVSILNAAMKHLELPVRCLPMGVGSVRLFRKIAEAVKLAGLVIDAENQEAIIEMVGEQHETVQQAKAADLVVYKGDKWHGFHTAAPAAVPALAASLKSPAAGDAPLKGKFVALVGLNGTTRAMAAALQKQGAAVIVVSHNKTEGQRLASELGCRYQHFAGLYTTAHDVLVVCGPDQEADRGGAAEVHPGYLRDTMTVMDLTATLRLSPLLREAASRGCGIVGPRKLFLEQMGMLVRMMTGKQVPREVLEAGIPRVLREEE